MLFLYLDESGDLGFDFVNKRPSSFFVVCILDKKKSYQSLWGDKERIYSHIAYLLLEKIKMDDRKPRIQLVIDRSKSKENIRAFDKFILHQLKGKIDPAVPLNISHLDSHINYCLQAVDLFCWGLFRKYETNDTVWYDVFKDKIKYENLAVL